MGSHQGITLYRSPAHLEHWIAHSERSGWLIFPARFNGWSKRAAYPQVEPSKLQQVPVWMAFNTGLLEAILSRAA
jgi:hypothetical protein